MVFKLPTAAIEPSNVTQALLADDVKNALVPVGGIIMWSGSIADIANLTAWELCDGQGGRPDLTDKFIIGASVDAVVNPGNITKAHTDIEGSNKIEGGNKDATLKEHSHTINNHTHSFSTTSDPGNHDHNVDVLAEFASTHGTWQTGGGYRQVHTGGTHRKPITSDAGAHTHSGTTGNPSDRGTDSQGSSAINANLPPYYALAFIIRVL